MRATARRDRLHLGAPRAPAAEAGQERVAGPGLARQAPGRAGRPGQPAATARRLSNRDKRVRSSAKLLVSARFDGKTDLRAAREGAPMRSVAGAGVVVTGGGSGIGAALARRFAAEGARVVVNDLNGAAAARVAEACGGTPAPGDAASEEGVAALVAAATEALGEVDMFCANAGVAREADSEGDWE